MGIPSFFRKIVQDYQGVTFWDDNLKVDHFYIDFNAMIYNVIYNIPDYKKLSPAKFENILLSEVINQLELLIT